MKINKRTGLRMFAAWRARHVGIGRYTMAFILRGKKMNFRLFNGDCLEVMKKFPDNSVDSIVTDPPYGLAFMAKKWDYDVPSVDVWREVLRALKPGGHLLAFGGTRTYHRLAVAIEDAGFEIRDQVQWLYGQGFPKSLDISKAIDKAADRERLDVAIPSTDAAKQWEGWGTALKPANEPICLARKPLEKGLTIAENVQKWGTGALNIDATRIPYDGEVKHTARLGDGDNEYISPNGWVEKGRTANRPSTPTEAGRFPANLILDEEAAALLDEQTGELTSGSRKAGVRKGMGFHGSKGDGGPKIESSSGGVSRFFYCAKASTAERNEGLDTLRKNTHPTVKPVKLMEYLIKLVTPPGGIVLDPFMGSGTTGRAADGLGFYFLGIEMNEQYFQIAQARIRP